MLSSHDRYFASPEITPWERHVLKPTGHLDRPCGAVFITAIPSHQRGFWWGNSDPKSLFPIKPISYLISKSFGAAIEYKENGFINSGLTLWQKTWIGKQGKDLSGAGPGLQPCGWNPVWESRIHKFWPMYTHSVKSYFPSSLKQSLLRAYLLVGTHTFSDRAWERQDKWCQHRFMFMEGNVRNLVLSGMWGWEGAFQHYSNLEAWSYLWVSKNVHHLDLQRAKKNPKSKTKKHALASRQVWNYL